MHENSPLVSIIMAVRDTEPYLPACLQSIISQTYKNWELIAVNDHSTDRTPQILARFAQLDSRIKYFDGHGHRLIPTLQEAYAHASGALINRMDSDDKMPPDKIESLVIEWQKYGPGYVIAGGTQHFVDNGEVGGGFLRYETWLNEVARNSTHLEEIYKECVIPSHSWMMHRSDFDRIGKFDPLVYPEDYDLCFRMYKEGLKIVGIDKVLHYWRDRSDRISRTWKEYKDNRYFGLKVHYFFQLDRDIKRPLVIWGAGKNGKDLVKEILKKTGRCSWVCDNERKIGKEIYGLELKHYQEVLKLENPQILIVVSSNTDRTEIEGKLKSWLKSPRKDYWFFL